MASHASDISQPERKRLRDKDPSGRMSELVNRVTLPKRLSSAALKMPKLQASSFDYLIGAPKAA
jgi:hypothetical protein